MSDRLRRVLYRAVNYVVHPGDAAGEARRRKVYSVVGRQPVRVVRAAGEAGGLRELATDRDDVWCESMGGVAEVDGTGNRHGTTERIFVWLIEKAGTQAR